jgi:multiple sugar transport system ATP-binding protein
VTTLYVTHDQTEAMTLGDRVGVLRDGVLQQVAAPGDLYRRPSNLFVAGFVGSPPMNLAEGTVEEEPEGLFIRFGRNRISAGDSEHSLRPFAGRQVVVGVRPEDLDDPSAPGLLPHGRLRVVVERRETIGPDVYLHFTVDAPLLLAEDPRDPEEGAASPAWPLERSNLWLARAGTSAAQPGDRIELGVRSDGLRLFDPRTGALVVP